MFYGSARRNFDGAEAGIAQRLLNQAILDDEHSPRRLVLLMTEGSLGWALLPPAEMAAQIDHIAAARVADRYRGLETEADVQDRHAELDHEVRLE